MKVVGSLIAEPGQHANFATRIQRLHGEIEILMNEQNDTAICVYCDLATSHDAFSDEHIWPAALGGNLMGGHFRTRRVCKACNNKCGLFVDGAFIRSFLSKGVAAYESLRYADFRNGRSPVLPLIYLGKADQINPALFGDFSVCEWWLSPCRSRILHFHSNDSPKFSAQAGGNPISSKKDPGLAIFCPASKSRQWLTTGLKSFARHFSRATRYVAFMSLMDSDHEAIGAPLPSTLLEPLVALGKDGRLDRYSVTLSFDLDAEDRFLSKLALGVGHNVFGDAYLKTHFASLHRRILNERDPQLREELHALSIPFVQAEAFGDIPRFRDFLAWQGGILLALLCGRGGTWLVANVFSRPSLSHVSNQHPDKKSGFHDGVVHIIIPQLGSHVGPISLMDFVGYQLGHTDHPSNAELAALAALRVDPKTLPSLDEVSDEVRTVGPAY